MEKFLVLLGACLVASLVLADVEIMLMQMRTVFGRSRVHRVMAQKLARLKMRMEEEEG